MIHAEKATYPIIWMCRLLKVGRSSYYDWVAGAGTLSATAARRAELAERVKAVFEEYRQTYGCRRIARELNAAGVSCSVGLVADLMREQGLVAVQPRAYKVTTVPGEDDEHDAPDRIGRDFTAAAPGQRLVGDITYLRTDEGWLYLATVIDLCTRMVVGWQMADPHAHQPRRRRLGHGAGARARARRGGVSRRPWHAIHVERIRRLLRARMRYCVVSEEPGCAGTMRSPNHSSRR